MGFLAAKSPITVAMVNRRHMWVSSYVAYALLIELYRLQLHLAIRLLHHSEAVELQVLTTLAQARRCCLELLRLLSPAPRCRHGWIALVEVTARLHRALA